MTIQKGQVLNPNGRKKGATNKFSIAELRRAIENVQKHKKLPLLEHFVEQAYTDNTVLIAFMRKIVPDMKSVDLKGLLEDHVIFVERK